MNRATHPRRLAILALSLAALSSSLCAQRQVFIVDAANGPGTSFTDLPPAIASARSGDLLILRAGNYTAFETSKGVTILGESGALIALQGTIFQPAVRVHRLPRGEAFTLSGITIGNSPFLSQRVEIQRCVGRVHLEDIHVQSGGTFVPNSLPAVLVEDSAPVTLANSRLVGQPALLVRRSTLVATDSECVGVDGFTGHGEIPSGNGIHAEASDLTLSRCVLRGGRFNMRPFTPTPGTGLSSVGSTWTVLGDETTTVEAGAVPGRDVSAMVGTGTLRANPIVTFIPVGNAAPIDPGIAVTLAEIPSVQALGAPLGGTVNVDLFAASNDLYALFVGLPGTPLPLGTLGTYWLDPGFGPIIAALGTMGAGRHAGFQIPVPNDPLIRGAHFSWQALAGSSVASLLFSNPGSYVHD